jgi:hypothetical protein
MLKLNKEKIKNNSFVRLLRNFANSNFVANIVVGIMIWVIALIPIWIYLISRALIIPVGFWQEFALFSVFAILIGWLQAIFIIFGAVCTIVIVLEGHL